jgi:maltose alpha-D-glucosyltransferase/alpha-amylase
MIALRKLFQVFGRGTLEFLHPENRKILAYIRDYKHEDGSSETVLCVANLSRFAQPVALDMEKFAGRQPVEMLGYVSFPAVTDKPYPLTLAPYSFLWLELQPAPPPIEAPIEPVVPTTPALPPTAPADIATWMTGERLESIESFLPAYIAQQRWFGDKSRGIRSARVASWSSIGKAAAVLAMVEITFDDDTTDIYQMPLAMLPAIEAAGVVEHSPNAAIATLDQAQPATVLIDASASPTFQSALLQSIIAEDKNAPESGPVAATRSATLDPKLLNDLPSRVGSAEQSNTSILYNETAILKLFRRVHTGENPEVEIGRFLTDVAHFQHTPGYLGDLHLASDGTTLAFLQAFAPNEGDGWAWTLDELGRFYEGVATCPAPPVPSPLLSMDAVPPAKEILEHAAIYLDAAQLLGRRTAELHLGLATPTDNPAFSMEPFSDEDLARDRERIHWQATTALDALESAMPQLPPETGALATSLLQLRDRIFATIDAFSGEAQTFGSRIRIHGDYHLGQLLRSRNDFLIVDFEGEPSRSLEERRHKQTPLRDAAGMLRSFSYAARTALDRILHLHPESAASLSAWADVWESSAGNMFLQAYLETAVSMPNLIPHPAQREPMLRALLLEKALYELLYELNNRPAWLAIPLHGLLNLLDTRI